VEELASHVQWLQSYADHSRHHAARVLAHAYDMSTLVQAVCLSGMLIDAGQLRSALKLGLAITLPQDIASLLQKEIEEHRVVPSRTTLYRHRLTITLGYYVSLQAVFAKMLFEESGVVRYEAVDSSPQGGFDYVMRMVVTIPVARIQEAFELSCRLCLNSEDAGEEYRIRDRLQNILFSHSGCITSVGSGRCGLQYKLACFLHSIRMESDSWSMCSALASSVFAFTTDFGTERGLGAVGQVRLASLFPWLEPPAFRFDDVGGALFGIGDAFENIADGDRIVNLASTVHIPGSLHILHNMTKDMLNVLQYSDVWVSQLSSICKLLSRSWSKRRLLFTCFREGHASAFAKDVATFHAEVHTGRWASIAFAVSQLSSIRVALVAGPLQIREALGVYSIIYIYIYIYI
jgi:hypothetical protein